MGVAIAVLASGCQASTDSTQQPSGSGAFDAVAAAQDSTARGDGGQAESADTPDWQQLLKDLWGHLPERVREQLIQAPTDEFLPKYKLEIEKYFRRLAEDGQDDNGHQDEM